jgi:GNAT superfamily N-acetyltransferase
MNLEIRNTSAEDLKDLAQIYRKAYDRPEFGEDWSEDNAYELLKFYFDLPTFLGFTALVEGKVVGGFFSFIKPWHDGKHLGEGELFVGPEYQNQKIGTKLMLEMMKAAKENGCVVHELIAYDKVAEWYKKLGLEDTGLHHMSGSIEEIILHLINTKQS